MKFETMMSIVNFCAGFVIRYFTDVRHTSSEEDF